MSTSIVRNPSRSLAAHAVVAAIFGAVCTDAFISIAHHLSPVKLLQYVASAGFGPVAYTLPGYAWAGLVFHLLTALIWALLYAYVWSTFNSLRNWVLGGIVLGVVVDVCMDAFLALRSVLEPLTPSSITFGLITNVVFFGLPVAWYLSRYSQARSL